MPTHGLWREEGRVGGEDRGGAAGVIKKEMRGVLEGRERLPHMRSAVRRRKKPKFHSEGPFAHFRRVGS